MIRTAIIGCGSMGSRMARHLVDGGCPLACFDASAAVRQQLTAAGLPMVDSISLAVRDARMIVLSLPRAAIVDTVMADVHESVAAGAVVLDTSTSEPATSQHHAQRARDRGYTFIDAPVSGGPAAAGSGTMTMLLGGDLDALSAVEPILDRLTTTRVPVGGSGAGNAAKIANNMLCAANLVLVGEALRLADAVGVSAHDLLDGVNAGSGRSAVSEVNFPRWILNDAFDSGFTMGLMRKDVGLALTLAEQTGTALPGFAGIARLWQDSSAVIADDADFNAIYRYREDTHD